MPGIVRNNADSLGDLTVFAIQAITQRYSKDAPLELVSDVTVEGTFYLPLPTPLDGQYGLFEPEFSVIQQIEYPIGQQPPQFMLDSDFRIYRAPDGYRIVLSIDNPNTTDPLRISWTSRHSADGSTVPDKDFYAVADYASSLALEALAAFYLDMSAPSISADTVNYQNRSQQALTMARAIRKRYYTHMGIGEESSNSSASSSSEAAPAFAMGNQYLEQNSGVDRLVHGKYTR
jgi:hypothetical protein